MLRGVSRASPSLKKNYKVRRTRTKLKSASFLHQFLIFIPFTVASSRACWRGRCYFSFCEGNRFGLMQALGVGRFNLPGLWDSVTISQTGIVRCEVLSRSLVPFSFPLVFPNAFLRSSVRTSWHKYKWQMTDDINVRSQIRRQGRSTTSRWWGGNRPCPLHYPYSLSKHSNKKNDRQVVQWESGTEVFGQSERACEEGNTS